MGETERKSYISEDLIDATEEYAVGCGELADSVDDATFSLEEMLAIAGELWKLSDSSAWMDRYIYDKDARLKKEENVQPSTHTINIVDSE
jgi:hypothetical protein